MSTHRQAPVAAACLSLMLAASAQAQTPQQAASAEKAPPAAAAAQTQTQTLAPVTVTATRVEQSITDIPASVSVIKAQDIAKKQPRLLVDVLRDTEGVNVIGAGSLSLTESFSLRGVPGLTAPTLIDGMPVESPIASIHQGNKGIVPFDLEQVDVLRGPASALYGANAVGGVVNFISKRWRGKPGMELELGGGTHNSRQVSAAAGAAWDVADFRLSATDYRTDGFTPRPQPAPGDLGYDRAPREGKRQTVSFTGNLRPADNQEISLALRQSKTFSPWYGGHPNFHVDNIVGGADLGYRYEAGDWGVFKARFRHWEQKMDRAFDDEDSNGNQDSLILSDTDAIRDRSQTLDVQADLRLSESNRLSLGATYAQGKDQTDAFNVLTNVARHSEGKSRSLAFFVQDEHRFTPQLSLLAGARWDRFRFYGDARNGTLLGGDSAQTAFSPRLALNYKLDERVSFYASTGTGFVPAQNFFKRGMPPRFRPNPDIKPESSVSYEMGARYQSESWLLRGALFHTDYKNRITPVQLGATLFPRQWRNVGRVGVDGVELAAQGSLPGGWQPWANYTWNDSRIKQNPSNPATEGKRNMYFPAHKFNLGLTYAPTDAWYASASGQYVGAYYQNDRNTPESRQPGRFVANVKFGYRLPVKAFAENMELTFAVNNLFNKKYVEWYYDQADGRNVWLGLSAKF